MKLLLGLSVLLVVGGALAATDSVNSALTKALLEGYEKRSPPDHKVNGKFGLSILNMGLCPMKQVLDVVGWMRMSWTDKRLSWNATNWGINEIKVPHEEIWIPDFSIYSGASRLNALQPNIISNAVIYPTGKIVFVPAVTFESICQIDFKKFPFGTQNCTIKIGSWTNDMSSIDIEIWAGDETGTEAFEFENFPTNLIEIKDHSVKKVVKTYDCCPNQVYGHLEFNLVFKQKAKYHHGSLHTSEEP